MTIVAGIDEAGLGPSMGPLVVTAVTFEVPDEAVGTSLWNLLATTVSRRPSGRGICIADSKKLYAGLRGRGGLAALERGVLAGLGAGGDVPANLGSLLDRVAPGTRERCRGRPWYAVDGLALPRGTERAAASADAERLRRRMNRSGVRLLDVRSEVVLEMEFNRLVLRTGNKSEALFEVNARLLDHVARVSGGRSLRVHLDRHGGRKRYLASLQQVFEDRWIWALEESPRSSVYRVDDGGRSVELDFTVGGDDLHLPVALASMVSKYVRELFMELLNGYWAGRVPGLAPTAGYHLDGRRFFSEIEPTLAELGLDPDHVRRRR